MRRRLPLSLLVLLPLALIAGAASAGVLSSGATVGPAGGGPTAESFALAAASLPEGPGGDGVPSALPLQLQPGEPPGIGARRIAAAIAAEFGVSEAEVLALHQQGIGFGALYKVYQLAQAKGTTAAAVVGAAPRVDGKPQLEFGQQFKDLTPAEQARLQAKPKNLGQAVSKGKGRK